MSNHTSSSEGHTFVQRSGYVKLSAHVNLIQILQLCQGQHHKLGNLLLSNANLYQIMRHDHLLGIDTFLPLE